jgi:hypothetical protein
MPERSPAPSARPGSDEQREHAPTPEIVDFIRFCHRRRRVGWPEIYDEMCAVAARREFKGWDADALAARGVTLTLYEMPRLAAWVRAVLASSADPAPRVAPRPAASSA